jgi:hypothetical protein
MPILRIVASSCGSLLSLALAMLLGACETSDGSPELALIYNASASYHAPDRNPIIAVPGLLGSKLRDKQTDILVWGAFDSSSADPDNPDHLRLISLPIGDGVAPLAQLRDDVEPTGVLDKARISLLGIPFELEVYAGILATLGIGGYRDQTLGLAGEVDYGSDHFTCFQFAYDWRRDIVESARLLHQFILKKRDFVRAQYMDRYGVADPEVKFDIVTHSMGGLVTRYFLMYGSQDLPADGSLPELTWEGAEFVERVIFVGTPNAGSVLAFDNLINGKDLGPFLPIYPPALLGTFPSTYQLLPRSRHRLVVWDGELDRPIEDLLDPALWERLKWGLAAPNQGDMVSAMIPDVSDAAERRRRAVALQAQILQRTNSFMAAMDRPATPPAGLELFSIIGDGFETPKHASVDSRTGAVRILDTDEGDGTVLRASALLDERLGGEWQPQVVTPLQSHRVLFLPSEHIDLTKSQTFRDNVLFWLLEDPRITPDES